MMYFLSYEQYRTITQQEHTKEGEYAEYIQIKIQQYQNEGLIKNIDTFKENSQKFWEEEKLKSEPHETMIAVFEKHATVIDKCVSEMNFDSLTNIQKSKKIQVLKTILKHFNDYEKGAIEDGRRFKRLPTKRKSEIRGQFKSNNEGEDDLIITNENHKRLNAQAAAAKDINGRKFVGIDGLRLEIDLVLKETINITVPNVLNNENQSQCETFGSHQIFRMYQNQVQKHITELNARLQDCLRIKTKNSKNEKYVCVCGKEVTRTNKSHHEKKSPVHLKFVENQNSDQIVLCTVVKNVEDKKGAKADEEISPIILNFDFSFIPDYDNVENTAEYFKKAAEVMPIQESPLEDDRWMSWDMDPCYCYTKWRRSIDHCLVEIQGFFSNPEVVQITSFEDSIVEFVIEEELQSEAPVPEDEKTKDSTENHDEDNYDDNNIETEKEDNEQDETTFKTMTPYEEKQERKKYEAFLKDIDRHQTKKGFHKGEREQDKELKLFFSDNPSDEECTYQMILDYDYEVTRIKTVISAINQEYMKAVCQRSKSQVKLKILLEDKIVQMFKMIKSKYKLSPKECFLERYHSHPRINEIRNL